MSAGNPKNSDDHQLKELRVALPKMKLSDTQNQPSISSEDEKEMNTTSGETAENKSLESDDSSEQSRPKVPVNSYLRIKFKGGRVLFDPPKKKVKKLPKRPKKRTISDEKKKKAESGNSGKQAKKRRIASKGKAKEKFPTKTSEEVHEFKKIKNLLRDDPTLPAGWKRIIKGKHVGTELKPVVCIASPEGRKFYFKARLKEYLEKNNSDLTIDDFYFGLYERSDKDKGETSAGSEGKKSKKRQRKTADAAQDKEHDSKKIRLDSGPSPKKRRVSKGSGENVEKSSESSGEEDYEAGDKNLLLEDPDLPEGWVRKVLVKNDAEGCNKIQVLLISPDGKKFRRKHLLQKYLQKTKSTLDINQFYFGIYPRKDKGETSSKAKKGKEPAKSGKSKKRKSQKRDGAKDDKSHGNGNEPMTEDPNLPLGWRRHIKTRTRGESAGRMEVIIMSPDGKKFRSKGTLENYFRQKGLDMRADDFDFTVYGKNSKKYSSSPAASSASKRKRKATSSRKRGSSSYKAASPSTSEETETRESAMINYVSGLMLNSGLRSLRSERRFISRKKTQEVVLKNYLDSLSPEKEEDDQKSEISSTLVKKLALCRGDFRTLEDDAAETIANLTKDFVAHLAQGAMLEAKDENNLEYNDVAEFVGKHDSMAPFQAIIPKKLPYKEHLKSGHPVTC